MSTTPPVENLPPFAPHGAEGLVRPSFGVGSPESPAASRSSVQVREGSTTGYFFLSEPGAPERNVALFAAWGIAPFHPTDYDFLPHGAPNYPTPFDWSLYKSRDGEGTVIHISGSPTVYTTLGDTSLPGFYLRPVTGGTVWDIAPRDPLSPDVIGGGGGTTWVEPNFGGSGMFSSSIEWIPESPTEAVYQPSGGSGTITLADPCTWADVVAQAARVASEGYSDGTTALFGELSSYVVSYASGAGACDGTRFMRLAVSRYRWAAALIGLGRRRIVWREVTRRNDWGTVNGFAPTSSTNVAAGLSWVGTLYRRELSEPVARPYLDEAGAWSPTDLRWSEAPWRTVPWNAEASDGGEGLVLVGAGAAAGEFGYGGRPVFLTFATRLRFEVGSADAGLTVVLTLLKGWDEEGEEIREERVLPVVDGAATEDVVATAEPVTPYPGAEEGGFFMLEGWAVRRAGVYDPNVPVTVHYQQRRVIRTVGWAPIDSPDTVLAPERYGVRTTTQEWGINAVTSRGADYDSGAFYQVAVTGAAERVIVEAASLASGAVTATTTALAAEVNGEPASCPAFNAGAVGGAPSLTATLETRSAALPATLQLTVPIDRNQPDVAGEVLASVTRSEVLEAGAVGGWHEVACPLRGVTVFVEAAQAFRLP